MHGKNFSIHSTLRNGRAYTRLPFAVFKDAVLGKKYELSLVFIGKKRAASLNERFRKKRGATDVLSFALESSSGEIFINPHEAKRKAKDFGMSTRNYLGYIFIHACLHLKGYRHGSRMEKVEKRFLRRFQLI